jgi:hypothetical protein
MIDPALILAQLGQGERLVHEIQTNPVLAQAATQEATAKQLTEEQKFIQAAEKSKNSDSVEQRIEARKERRRQRKEQRKKRRQAVLQASGEQMAELSAPAADSQTDEVVGTLVNKSV